MRTLLQNLPPEIQSLATFVLWDSVTDKNGNEAKKPFDPQSKGRGNDDPSLHLGLNQALRMLQAFPQKKLGIGLYQPEGGIRLSAEGKTGSLHIIDLDGFVGPSEEAGKIKLLDLGWQIVELCGNSYLELSPSGIGAKLFVVSDLDPQKKQVFKLAPNEWSQSHPNIKKYNDSHAVEHFTEKFWNALTGDVWSSNFSQLRFVPRENLLEVFALLEALHPDKTKKPLPSTSSPALSQAQPVAPAVRRLTEASLIQVLTKIDNQTEPIWSDVANCLARTYGSEGEEFFVRYSQGSYNGKPYADFDEALVRARFQRALTELTKRPDGYGNKKLAALAGLSLAQLSFEATTASSGDDLDGITADELGNLVFPPLKWVVEGILPEGSYLLSARPKTGKSWMALQICLCVAFGTDFFGKTTTQGIAVYLALEDNHRRLQSRLRSLRPSGYKTTELHLFTSWPKFDQGGIEKLIALIEKHKPIVVVIDTLAKVRPSMGRNSSVYESDYACLAPITGVANKYRTTILIVTHNRKGKSDVDPLEQISGSLGLSGSVDGALVIDGNRSDKHYTLSLIGRDIPDDDDLAIKRASNGEWQLLGQAKQVFISAERKAIKDLLVLHPSGLAPKDIADQLTKKQPAVRKLLASMVADHQLAIPSKGIYALPSTTPLPAIHTHSSSFGGAVGGVGSSGGSGSDSNDGNDGEIGSDGVSGNTDHTMGQKEGVALPA